MQPVPTSEPSQPGGYLPPPPRPGQFAGPPRSDAATPLLSVATVLVGVWLVVATAFLQGAGWLAGDVAVIYGLSLPAWVWPVISLINALVVAGPSALLWLLVTRLRPNLTSARSAAAAWTTVGLVVAVLGSLGAIPVADNEILLLVTGLVAVVAAVIIRSIRRRSRRPTAPHPAVSNPNVHRVVGLAATAGLIVLLPWLWAGALGGRSETLAALLAAAAVGGLAASILDGDYFAGFARSRPWQVLVGGLATGAALLPLAAVTGGRGVGLLQLVTVPALGFALAALATSAVPDRLPGRAVAATVGLGVLGPLAFVDPEEVTQLLGPDDIGKWIIVASGLAMLGGWVIGAGFGLTLRPTRLTRRPVALALVLVVTAGAAAVYGLAGRPGFYGDRLFVILSDQADLSGLSAISDRSRRLTETYHRLVEHAQRSQAPLREELDRWGVRYTPYYLVNALLVDSGPELRPLLSRRSDVDRVLLDQRLRPLPAPDPTAHGGDPAPDATPQWNIALIGADRAWSEFDVRGQGIVVGTSDSGVDGSHPALRDGFRGGDDSWFDPWNGSATPTDHGGHGTHTLGSALGRGGIGVAPQAQWIGCVNLDRNLGSPSRYLDCLQFMLAPFPRGGDPWRDGHPQQAPHVLTNSWGCPPLEGCDGHALRPATAALRAAGIFFAAAAGNTGPFCASVEDPPAPDPDAFTVGAVDRVRKVAEFSSRGPTPDGAIKPDVVAPGVEVLSAMPGGTYATLDGTSMATPHVAGVVALMWSANPRLIGDIDTTEEILRRTASPVTPTYLSEGDNCGTDQNITGAGLINAYAAVKAATERSSG